MNGCGVESRGGEGQVPGASGENAEISAVLFSRLYHELFSARDGDLDAFERLVGVGMRDDAANAVVDETVVVKHGILVVVPEVW